MRLLSDRVKKRGESILKIEYLLEMNAAAYDAVKAGFHLGMTEKDVETIIFNTYKSICGNPFSFCGDIVGGKRSANMEGEAGSYVLQPGDTLILDLQPQIDSVFCDTTRTFFIGEPGNEVRRAYSHVKNTLSQLESFVKPDIKVCDVYSEMNRFLEQYGYNCPHHAGHIIGKKRLIFPEFLPEVPDIVKVGDTIALEPGFYRKNCFGIRLENNYQVTPSGMLRLFDYTSDIEDFIIEIYK